MVSSLVLTALIVALCFVIHFFVLDALAKHVYREQITIHRPLLLVIFILFLTHLFEVVLYALGLSLLDWAGYGRLEGAVRTGPGWFADHFYFSIASYTTLGIGDIVPHGAMRIMVGVEALNGLVLITWSASFTYLMMERLWGSR